MPIEFEAFWTSGLADNTYLLPVGNDAVLVDPQRDAWRFLAAAESRGLTLRYVLETHVHNDYVSGALEINAATGAEVAAPAGGNYRFPHMRMAEGDEIVLGDVALRAMETPGHTPEHVSYVVYEAGRTAPSAVFSGGSLILGSAGRTDLLGAERAEELARAQYRSLRRLVDLPSETRVLPTHGPGSFCASAGSWTERTSTVGEQRRRNPALRAVDEESFLRSQLSGLPLFPEYYHHMAGINRAGPAVLGDLPALTPLSAEEVARSTEAGAWVVDGRDRLSFAAGHVPGSINVELDDMFATYLGWVVPFGASFVLVLPEPTEVKGKEALTQLVRIGYERVEGYLAGGVEAWRSTGRSIDAYPVATVDELCATYEPNNGIRVLDVRQPKEWAEGLIPGSLQIFVGDLNGRLGRFPRDREVWAICASGRRASIAASLMDREGIPVRLVSRGGVSDWLGSCG